MVGAFILLIARKVLTFHILPLINFMDWCPDNDLIGAIFDLKPHLQDYTTHLVSLGMSET